MANRDEAAYVEIKIRIKEPLREQVEKTAAQRGVSMNAVVVDSLTRMLIEESQTANVLEQALDLRFGERLSAFVQIISTVIEAAGSYADMVTRFGNQFGPWRGGWLTNPYAYQQMRSALDAALDLLAPEGMIEPPPPITDEERGSKFWGLSARSFLDRPRPQDDLLKAIGGNHPRPLDKIGSLVQRVRASSLPQPDRVRRQIARTLPKGKGRN